MKYLNETEYRTMPGPPEYVETGSLGDWDSEDRWCNNWDLYWADGSVQYGVWERPDKRLTDAECAAEKWRAASDFRDRLRHGLPGEDLNPEWERRLIWHRFATLPHALEETT